MSEIQPLADGEHLFTSESVTEGHPDKICDQISDGVLDAVMSEDPGGRVACETLVNTGMAVVSGEISTSAHLNVPEIVRETIREIGYDNGSLGYDCDHISVLVSLDEQSSDIAQGVDKALETREDPSDDDELDVAGAGDQGMMFGYATNETEALMPMPIQIAHRLAERLSAVRKDGTLPHLRPDGKTQVTVRYADGRPGRGREAADLDPARPRLRGRRSDPRRALGARRHAGPRRRLRRGLRGGPAAGRVPGQPDRQVRDRRPRGRRRPDRPQDHRRHLRRRRPARRRRLLGEGPFQGRSLRGLRGAPRRQEHRRRRAGRALRGPGRLRDRRRPPGLGDGPDLRHRPAVGLGDLEDRQPGVRPAPGRLPGVPRPAPPDLPEDGRLRPLRPRRPRLHLGADRSGGRAAQGRRRPRPTA